MTLQQSIFDNLNQTALAIFKLQMEMLYLSPPQRGWAIHAATARAVAEGDPSLSYCSIRSVVHPLFISLGLEPFTVYDTLRKPYTVVTRIRIRVLNIAVHQLFRDARRERVARQPLVAVEVGALEAGEFDRGHRSELAGVGDNATAEAM